MTPYKKGNNAQKRGSSTQLRLQQYNSMQIIPDATSEGNRQELLHGMFFAG